MLERSPVRTDTYEQTHVGSWTHEPLVKRHFDDSRESSLITLVNRNHDGVVCSKDTVAIGPEKECYYLDIIVIRA